MATRELSHIIRVLAGQLLADMLKAKAINVLDHVEDYSKKGVPHYYAYGKWGKVIEVIERDGEVIRNGYWTPEERRACLIMFIMRDLKLNPQSFLRVARKIYY